LLRGDYKWVGNGESNAILGVAERGPKAALAGEQGGRAGRAQALKSAGNPQRLSGLAAGCGPGWAYVKRCEAIPGAVGLVGIRDDGDRRPRVCRRQPGSQSGQTGSLL